MYFLSGGGDSTAIDSTNGTVFKTAGTMIPAIKFKRFQYNLKVKLQEVGEKKGLIIHNMLSLHKVAFVCCSRKWGP